ncbi:MAG: Lrp/AsnC family transcriptional regulator [Deferribacteres bacterium]|nr:Lrp/AsnC family transcriptional regulator [candidate division KSB1 bacterium]MCB9504464.1 Lrp/AsnC family transcriptional regulator [Deferribacteres bacterium]
MHNDRMDEIDVKILEILQRKGRTKRNELADAVNLSIPSISERLRKLEEHGVLKGIFAVINPKKAGLGVTAFILIQADSAEKDADFVKKALEHPEILECHSITGDGSHMLKIRTRDTETLEKLIYLIHSWDGVKDTRTMVVLSSAKETSILPLGYLEKKIRK